MIVLETLLAVATEKVGERLLTGLNAKLNPQALETFLRQAVKAANEAQPDLFFSFQEDGVQGYGAFLNQFFKGRACSELQKPLEETQGYPDVALLTEALWKDAVEHPKLNCLNKANIEPWMQEFVATYFRETNRSLQFQIIQADYCDQIRRVFDDVKFAGIAVEGQDIDRAERLADIFVMPDVQEDDAGMRGISDDMPPEAMEDPQQRLLWEQRQQILISKQRTSGGNFSAADLLTKGKTNRAVLLGAPGSGKTTLMNYFAVIACSRDQLDENRGSPTFPISRTSLVPILIRIRDLARQPDLSILEFVQDFAQKDLAITRDLTGFFQYYLENGNTLILLDGLDEVADIAQRYKVVEKIEAFLSQFEHCPAIITSRPAGYKRDFFRTDEYPHYELQPFNDEKIETFIDHWYDSRFELESERERRQTSLRKALNDQPRIKQLARNPLLLTIIALIHRYQAKLPKERYKLYDKAVETLLTTWDSNKELSNHEILEYLELDDLRRLMERLAYWIHCQGGTGDTEGGTLIDRDELITQLTQYIREMKRVERHQAKAEAKRFLEQIVRDRAGLLSLQGQDRYAFVHKTFQEYLTAMEIRDRQEEGFEVVLEHIEEYLHNPHWEEVLLLLIAQQKRNNPIKVLQAILAHDTPYERWLHRNLLFAGRVLAENVPVADTELAGSIISHLMELDVTQSPLGTDKLRSRIFRVVSSLSETAFEDIALKLLENHKNDLGRWRYLDYQGALAPDQAVGLLLVLLQDDESDVRYRAAEALGQLGQGSDAVVAALLPLLQDDESDVRSHAAEALVKLGQGSNAVVATLLPLLQDDESDVRSHAAEALVKLGQGSNAVVATLLPLLQDDKFFVRSRTAEALGQLGQGSDAVVAALLPLLQDDESLVRSSAAEALGQLGQGSDAVVAALLPLLQDDKFFVRSSAAEALGQLGQGSDAVVAALLPLLQDDESFVRFSAALALAKLGQGSDAVVAALLPLLQDDEFFVRSSAALALVKLGQGSDAVVAALLPLLQDDKSFVRSRTAEALGPLGQGSNAVIAALLPLLQDDESLVRSRAAVALGQLGQGSDAVVAALLSLLQDDESFMRSRAAVALVKLGQGSDAVVAALLPLLQDDESLVRSRATVALINLDKQSDQVEPALVQWIEQHQTEDFVGQGVDVLWELVG
ncbi:MAG: HEAT repeat domain-containing protein [Leptolyngbya sp. SIO1E4]|nr:HEAT repeat domain-containing protein [Leptolyngbya sp. SIO1E4]